MTNIDKIEESGKFSEPLRSGIEQFGPEKIIHVETVKPVIGPKSGADGVAGPGNGKRKIVKKVIRVVKKVIKKRVPKRVLMHDSENQGLVVKAENSVNLSEVINNSSLANDGIGKSNFVDQVIEKTSIVNEAKETLNSADDLTDNSNLVNDAIEKSNIVDGVREKTSIINEVMEKAKITDDVTPEFELVSSAGVSESVIGEKGKDVSGIDSMETETSQFNFGESASEQLVPANDQSDINTLDTNNIKSNDVITCVPDSMEVEQVNCITFEKTESGSSEELETGKNRGFAFVRFETADDAKNVLAKHSKVEIYGKQCSVAPVGGNDTLFLGNIDRNWKSEDVVTLLGKAGIKKIDKVTLKPDKKDVEKNRGFAFVELKTSKDAQIAFDKLQKKDALGKNLMIKVAWAQPLIGPDEEEVLKVKSVYAEYLPSSWDEEKVKEYFKRFGDIETVALAKDLPSLRRKDVAFINYTNHDAALTCIETVSKERSENDCSMVRSAFPGYFGVKIAVSLAKSNSNSKPMKHTPDRTSKQLPKAKPKAIKREFVASLKLTIGAASIKLHEPRHKEKPASSSYDRVKVDNRPSTTDELVQILRQQASNKHIPQHPHPRTGTNDLHFPIPGSKRPFSLMEYDPHNQEPQGLSRVRVESSYPISGPSSSSRGAGVLSFPYHPQQEPGFTSESVIGRRSYPSHFQLIKLFDREKMSNGKLAS
ncbi:hypothetical protein DH2020_039715 [Rehmannia glutinosa]|uniref:RRM domain-containing protein n=1 Tax=Rehmannia glutinosa TaxID=99300 RepID=A0ABR0UW73_REHGL